MTFLIVTIINLLTFALTARGLAFKKAEEKPKQFELLKTIFAFNFFLQSYLIYTFRDSAPIAQTVGWVLQVISIGLFWWARHANRQKPLTLAYHNDTPTHLNRLGPYRFIRHPFYTAYILCFMACAAYTTAVLSLGGAVVMYWLYYRATVFEENKFDHSDLREEYQKFTAEAGRFWPKLF